MMSYVPVYPAFGLLEIVMDVMYAKVPYTVLKRVVHIHPTLSELIPTMAGDLQPLC
jgi:pyruvate/2-oxoglutarate dehydrogenase complex dihydrolipoamide dehydrogenase (E3) component